MHSMSELNEFLRHKRLLVVTGADSKHIDLLKDFITSFRLMYDNRFDVGLIKFDNHADFLDVENRFDVVVSQSNDYEAFRGQYGYYCAFVGAKPRLPELFPGYDFYCWVDADCWFCTSGSLMRIFAGAASSDIAIHPEYDGHYWRNPTPVLRTRQIYSVNENILNDEIYLNISMFNSGVFSCRNTSPVWGLWSNSLAKLRLKGETSEVYFSDQIPLHKLIIENNISVAPLRAIDNWQLYACTPLIDLDCNQKRFKLRAPSPPFEEIGILHLAGNTKSQIFKINDYEGHLTFSAIMKAVELNGIRVGGQ
jgi:hypothetical protein